MNSETRTNKEVIAVDQDPLGVQGHRVRKGGDAQMGDGSRTVVPLNTGSGDSKITVKWPELCYPSTLAASARDLWAHQDLGTRKGTLSANVPSHRVVMISVKP